MDRTPFIVALETARRRLAELPEELRAWLGPALDHLAELAAAPAPAEEELTRANRALRAEMAERRRAEQALRQSHDLISSIIEKTTDAVYAKDAAGRILLINSVVADLLGRSAAEVIGRDDVELLGPEAGLALRRNDRLVLETGKTYTFEESFQIDGTTRVFISTKGALRDAQGRVTGLFGISREITERRAAEAALRASEERRQRLIEQLLLAQEDERRRIARDLHDEVGQSLTSLAVRLRSLEEDPPAGPAELRARAGELRRITSAALVEVGRLARGLRPALLDELGLVAALERLVAEFRTAHGLDAEFHGALRAPGLTAGRLPWAVETALYRIVQEALTNVVRHARASTVNVILERRPDGVALTVEDDGLGFDSTTVLGAGAALPGLGLASMRERAALLGGTLLVESRQGNGTAVRCRLPVAGGRDRDEG